MSGRYRGRKPGSFHWWALLLLWAVAAATVALTLSTTAGGWGL